jgi:hypothetical protein
MARASTKVKEMIVIEDTSDTSTALATLQEQMEREAAQEIMKQVAAPSSNGISIRNKQFKLPDGRILDGPIEVVILDFVSKNLHYTGRFDSQNPSPPKCFAIGRVITDMKPSANSPDVQSDSCNGCPMNEFGSDGAAKACKNTRLLAVVEADVPDAPIMTLSVPPKSLKAFDGYVSKVASLLKRTPYGVVTRIGFHPEAEHEQLVFGNPTPNPQLVEHVARRPEAEAMLFIEPDTSRAEAAPRKPANRRR